MRQTTLMGALASLLVAASCQNVTAPRPAVLVSQDAQSMTLLKEAAAEHMGRAKVDLGPGDLTMQSTISVLPPRVAAPQGNSVAMPKILELRVREDDCYLFDEAEGRAVLVRGLACRPLD